MTLTIYHDDNGGNCTTSPVGTPITLSGASGGAIATGLWVISEDYAPGSGDKTFDSGLEIPLFQKRPIRSLRKLPAEGGQVSNTRIYLTTKLDGASTRPHQRLLCRLQSSVQRKGIWNPLRRSGSPTERERVREKPKHLRQPDWNQIAERFVR